MTDLKTPEARKIDGRGPSPDFIGMPYVVYRDEDAISLVELAQVLYAERRMVIAIVFLATLVSVIPPLLTTRLYRAEVLLAPVASARSDGISALIGQFGDLASVVERYVGGPKDQTAESIATLTSRSLGISFIQEQKLKPRLFPEEWDEVKQRWRDAATEPTDLEAYTVFDKSVRELVVDRRSGLVTLSIEWTDPALAATWANALVTTVNQRRRSEAISEAKQSIKYLQQELNKTGSVEIRQAIYRLIEAQTKAIALANAREEYAFKVIDPAVAPERPVGRGTLVRLVAGLLVGVLLAGLAVVVRRAFSRPAVTPN